MTSYSPKTRLLIYYLGNSRVETNLDGGARIFIETAKRWVAHGHVLHLLTTVENYEVCRRYGLSNLTYTFISSQKDLHSVYLIYILRMFRACVWALTINIPQSKNVIVYSGSDFWPDSIPAWILKIRFRSVNWIAAFYLFAPRPFSKESPYKKSRILRGLLYYLSQIPVYWLIRKYADMVWVTSEPDRWKFVGGKLSPNEVLAVRGGVDIKMSALVPEPKDKRFDAVFIGRFHPQKGVLELIDIWKYVFEKKKNAKLAMIGFGDLEREVKDKIRKYGLEDNITLFGFKDGVEKLKIFKDSKVVLHPAIYDSGGMAACEAMACGLPGVSFDLPALKTYYPKGMLKTPCYDLEKFGETILKLLTNEELYINVAKDAVNWAREWDWDKMADELLNDVNKLRENSKDLLSI